MDVASSFAVSIAPPAFQKEVEEARRDTQNRVSIPKPQESSGSAAQSHIKDGRGNTDGENSLLNAQQQGVLDAQEDLTIQEKNQRRKHKKNKQNADTEQDQDSEHQQSKNGSPDKDSNLDYDEDNAPLDPNEQYDIIADDSEHNPTLANYCAGHFNPETGCYEIPASRFHKPRSILLKFREQNVRFLDHFSDKTTAVGLINFALSRKYGSIIPHSRLGQVVERLA